MFDKFTAQARPFKRFEKFQLGINKFSGVESRGFGSGLEIRDITSCRLEFKKLHLGNHELVVNVIGYFRSVRSSLAIDVERKNLMHLDAN